METSNVGRIDRLMDKVREGFAGEKLDYAGPIQGSKIMKMARWWLLDMNEYKVAHSLCFGGINFTRQRAREVYKEMLRIDNECWKLSGAQRKAYMNDSVRKFLLELRQEEIIDFKTKAKKWNI